GEGTVDKVSAWAAANDIALADAFARADEVQGLTSKARAGAFDFARVLRLIRERDSSGVPLADVVRTAFEDSGLLASFEAEGTVEAESRAENLQELAGVAEEFEKGREEEGAEARLA